MTFHGRIFFFVKHIKGLKWVLISNDWSLSLALSLSPKGCQNLFEETTIQNFSALWICSCHMHIICDRYNDMNRKFDDYLHLFDSDDFFRENAVLIVCIRFYVSRLIFFVWKLHFTTYIFFYLQRLIYYGIQYIKSVKDLL